MGLLQELQHQRSVCSVTPAGTGSHLTVQQGIAASQDFSRGRSLSSIRIISLPLGTPHINLSRVEGSSKHYFNLSCSLAHG